MKKLSGPRSPLAQRQQKVAEDSAEAAANPAWYTRAWNSLSGSGNGAAEPATAPAAATLRDAAEVPVHGGAAAAAELAELAASTASTGMGADFEAAAHFGGARAGYVFKVGPKGLGYYQDSNGR